MPVQLFTNNATTLLDADIDSVVITLNVTAGKGALFPSPTAGDWFYATLESGSVREIVQVTTRATDTFTIVRAQDGTSATSWTAGATIELRMSKVWFDTVHTEDSLPAAGIGDTDGPGGGVVDGEVALFDGTTGKLLKGSGATISGDNTGDQTISDATIATSDITDQDATTAKHGFLPKGTNITRHFLRSDITYAPVPGLETFDPVVNPGLNLWQRGNTFTGLTSADMLADQYEIEFTTDVGIMDASRVNPTLSAIFTASGQRINHALRVDVTTIDASIGVAEFVHLSQKIEGYRAAAFMHNEFTCSFFVRSNLTGQFALAVGNSGDDRNYIKTWSPAVADTWERISLTIPAQDRTGTWDYQTGIGLILRWVLAAGTDHDGTDDTWNSTADFAVVGTENFLSSTSNYIELTGVQLDMGPDAKVFRGIPYDRDLAAAERHFQKSYDVAVNPGATSALGQVVFRAHGTNHLQHVPLRPMLAAPTVALYNPTDGTVAQWEDIGAAAGVAMTSANSGMNGFEANITTSVDLNEVNGHWTAEARL